MKLSGINHLAFITPDMNQTVRFYRDLLGLTLHAGIGHDGFRHYFLMLGDGTTQIAFFEYEGASIMERKFPGDRTSAPLGFDHLSFTINSKESLFGMKDRLEAAGVEVHGAVDHGLFWSIYFYDPNNIPLEITWQFMEATTIPAIVDDDPLEVEAEGAAPRPETLPKVTNPTQPRAMRASAGNGKPLRDGLLASGAARYIEGFEGEG